MDTQEILMQFKNGEMSLEEAEAYLKRQPFEDMGYAKLDSHRKLRSGFAEVIFCSGKADAPSARRFSDICMRKRERCWERGRRFLSTN